MPGLHGQKLGSLFRLGSTPSFVIERDPGQELAVSLLESNVPCVERSLPHPREDAFIASTSLTNGLVREAWIDERPVHTSPLFPRGTAVLLDLRRNHQVLFESGFRIVHFYFSLAALNSFIEEHGGRRVSELKAPLGVANVDAVFPYLASSLLTGFERPQEVSRIFVDYLLQAATTHLLQTHSDSLALESRSRGGLAPWQQRRAQELLDAHIDGNVSISDIASECRLSLRHFSRAFSQSLGMPPHRWLIQRRVERAKQLLAVPENTLGEIAIQSGFSDQSHFTRVFSQVTGTSPGAWRRIIERNAGNLSEYVWLHESLRTRI
jgi:AraC family transcriptional regulator